MMIKKLFVIFKWLGVCVRQCLQDCRNFISPEDSLGCLSQDEVDAVDSPISDSRIGMLCEMEVHLVELVADRRVFGVSEILDDAD